MARVYKDVNSEKPREYWDYHNYELEFGNHEKYKAIRKIGRGKYSDVYEGYERRTGKRICIKKLKPIEDKKIKRETKILKILSGGPFVIELIDLVYDPKTESPWIITEYVDNVDFRFLFPTLSEDDIKLYCFQILLCIDYTHSQGIIHRDIKPNNIMIDHTKKHLRIIDWGLAEFYHPTKTLYTSVASRFYKGPEILSEYKKYDYALDMWSFGCMFSEMIIKVQPFFRGTDNDDQLVQICERLGTRDYFKYLDRFDIPLPGQFEDKLYSDRFDKKSIWGMKNRDNSRFMTHDSVDLIEKLLVFDHHKRLSAKEAMEHPYFSEVRKLYKKD